MFIAYAISTFGDWFDMIAVFVLMAYTWHADPLMIALVPITFALPGMLLSSFAGVVADRWRKRRIMILVSFISAVLTGLLVLVNHIYLVFLILLLRSTVEVFQSPAEQALTRVVVSKADLLKATSFNQIINQVAKIAGPLLGGVLLAVMSPKICLLVNAISFVLAGFILLTIRKVTVEDDDKQEEVTMQQSFRKSWQEGWIFMFKNRVILWTLLIGLVASLVIQLVDSQFAVLFRVIAPNRPSIMGWIIASVGLGAVVSITLINKRDHIKYGLTLGIGAILVGVGFVGIGRLHDGFSLCLALGLGIVAGIGNGLWMVTFNYVLQNEAPKSMVGRVFGIVNVMMSAVLIIGPIAGGIFIHYMGPDYIFQWVGWVVSLVGFVVLLFRNKLYPDVAKVDIPEAAMEDYKMD